MTLGIDIGGTNLSFGLVENSKVAESFSVPSFAPDATLEETLEYLASKIRTIITPSVKKIGIGVPSVVDVKHGIVYDTQNIPSWTVVPLKEYLENQFHIPVAVNNDANCYALGVYGTYPAGERPETLVAMTLGAGLGIGIVDKGVLFCGANCALRRPAGAAWTRTRPPRRGTPPRWPSSRSSAATWAPPSAR